MPLPKINASKRDAPHLWGGLRYQKLVTLCAWLDLRDGELLHVEKEEDFAVARPGSGEAVQVRRTRADLTLGREDARKIIEIAWGRDPAIVTVYWTTSPAGREGRLYRAHQTSGVELWARAAAGDDAALQTLRDFLLHRGGWSEGLAAALRDDAAGTLRENLFRRLKWEVKRPPTSVLETRARTELRALLETRGPAPASATQLILPHCLERIDAVASKDAEARHLDSIDLEEVLESALRMVRNVNTLDGAVSIGGQASSYAHVISGLDAMRRRLERAGLTDLEAARHDLTQGRVHAAIHIIDQWAEDPDVEGDVRAAAFRLRAEASLALGDIAGAIALAGRADTYGSPADERLSLLILAAQDPSAALGALQDAEGPLAWLRAELLIKVGDGDAARTLAEGLDHADDDAYATRVRAMAHAAAGDVKRALEIVEPLRARATNVDLTTAAATFHYVAAQAKGVTVAITDWPAPINAGLVRQSDKGQEHLRLAANLFGQAAQLLDDARQKADREVWRLAALAGLRDACGELDNLLRTLTGGVRPHPGAVHWALNRGLAIDTAAAEAKFATLLAGDGANGEDCVAYAALLAFRGAERDAVDVLRRYLPELPPRESDLVQFWIDRLSRTESQADPVSKALREAQASGNWAPVEALVAAERPAEERFTLLQILAGHDRWAAVASHADFLTALDTGDAIRLAALARFNTANVGEAVRLLEEKVDVFPGSVRPDDVMTVYVEGLAASGRLPEAFAHLETWTPRQASRGARMMEIRLRLNLGDLEGVAGRAVERFDELPPAFRLQVASRIAPAAPEQARALLRTIDIKETPIALAPMAYEAAEITKLDRDLRHAIAARLFGDEAQEAGVVTSLTMEQVLELVRTDTESRDDDRYEQGDAMLHSLADSRIGRAFIPLLSETGPAADLYARDAAAEIAAPISAPTLRLDVTAILTAHALGLLDMLYAAFDRVEVGQHLQIALQTIERDLHVVQPEKLEALQALLSLVDAGHVAVDLAPTAALRLGFVADGAQATCGDIVDVLAREGGLTASRATLARDVFGREAAGVSDLGEERVLATNAGVAALLVEAGVIEPLLEARQLILDRESVEAARAEATALARRQKAAASVTGLRQRLWRDLRQGRVHVLPLAARPEDHEDGPSAVLQSMLELRAAGPAVVWVEDRALHLRRPLGDLPLVAVFDIIEHLRGRESGLTDVEVQEALRRLREAGFRFQPIVDSELLSLLRSAPVQKGEVVETPELAACRRAFARDLMAEKALRLHTDAEARTVETRFALAAVRRLDRLLKQIWDDRASLTKKQTWSDWLWSAFRCDRLERVPIVSPNEAGRRVLFEINLGSLLSAGLSAGRTRKDKVSFYEWLWTRILGPEIHADPSLALALPAKFATFWAEPGVDEDGNNLRDTITDRRVRADVCLTMLMHMPEPMRDLLMENPELRRFLAPRLKGRLTFGDFKFVAGPVLAAVVAVHRTGRSRRVVSDDETLKVKRHNDGIVIERSAERHRLLVGGDMLAIIAGDGPERVAAVGNSLSEHDLGMAHLSASAAEVAAIEDPYERLVRLNDIREATIGGKAEALRLHAESNSLTLEALAPPPPEAMRRWLRLETGASPDLPRLCVDLGPAGLERACAAPLRAWGKLRTTFKPEDVAAYIAEPAWTRSPLGDLARLGLLAVELSPEALRAEVVTVLERFRAEGEAFVQIVHQLNRQADREARWREEDEVFRSLAMWVWADIIWRTLASARCDPVALAKFWKQAGSARPRDLVLDARASAAMASPMVSAARLLACGLSSALGERGNESWTEADGAELAKSALDAARTGKPLGPLSQAPDRDVTWLADASPFIWRDDGVTPEVSAAEAVDQYPSDDSKLALVAIGGPDAMDADTADALLGKLEAEPERYARGDRWIAELRFATLAVKALRRRGVLDEDRSDRAFTLFGRMIEALRQRPDWEALRESVYHHVLTLAGGMSADRIAKVLANLFDTAAGPDRKLLQQVAKVFLAALPFEERAPVWREHLRMRWLR